MSDIAVSFLQGESNRASISAKRHALDIADTISWDATAGAPNGASSVYILPLPRFFRIRPRGYFVFAISSVIQEGSGQRTTRHGTRSHVPLDLISMRVFSSAIKK